MLLVYSVQSVTYEWVVVCKQTFVGGWCLFTAACRINKTVNRLWHVARQSGEMYFSRQFRDQKINEW